MKARVVKRIFFISLFITVLAFILFLYYLNEVGKQRFAEPLETNYTISFEGTNDTLYINAKAWGITGNHEMITLSTTKPTDNRGIYNQKGRLYDFHTTDLFYKKAEENTLTIYVSEHSIDSIAKNTSDISVIIEPVSTEKLEDLRENYMDYGLGMISIYEEADSTINL